MLVAGDDAGGALLLAAKEGLTAFLRSGFGRYASPRQRARGARGGAERGAHDPGFRATMASPNGDGGVVRHTVSAALRGLPRVLCALPLQTEPGVTWRGLAESAGVGMLVAADDAGGALLLVAKEGLTAAREFVRASAGVDIAGDAHCAAPEAMLPALEKALHAGLQAVLEQHYLAVQHGGYDMLLDTSSFRGLGGSEPCHRPLQVAAGLALDLSLEQGTSKESALTALVSVRIHGLGCKVSGNEFSPRDLLCPEAARELQDSGRVDLRGDRFWRTYFDFEREAGHRSTRVRVLPSLEEVHILQLSLPVPPPHLNGRHGGTATTVSEHRRWWGEHFGLWLPLERIVPFCVVHHDDGLWSVVPAGCIWPAAGLRQMQRPEQVPHQAALRRLCKLLEGQRLLGATLSMTVDEHGEVPLRTPTAGFRSAAQLHAQRDARGGALQQSLQVNGTLSMEEPEQAASPILPIIPRPRISRPPHPPKLPRSQVGQVPLHSAAAIGAPSSTREQSRGCSNATSTASKSASSTNFLARAPAVRPAAGASRPIDKTKKVLALPTGLIAKKRSLGSTPSASRPAAAALLAPITEQPSATPPSKRAHVESGKAELISDASELRTLTVAQLKLQCSLRQLRVGGTRPVLLERLNAAAPIQPPAATSTSEERAANAEVSAATEAPAQAARKPKPKKKVTFAPLPNVRAAPPSISSLPWPGDTRDVWIIRTPAGEGGAAASSCHLTPPASELVAAAFARFDQDLDGALSVRELNAFNAATGADDVSDDDIAFLKEKFEWRGGLTRKGFDAYFVYGLADAFNETLDDLRRLHAAPGGVLV